MSGLGVYIVIGDLIVSGVLIALAAWLFSRDGKEMDEAARIPLEDPDAPVAPPEAAESAEEKRSE